MKEDKVLLKLHRIYSKDEGINYALAEIKRLKMEIGILKSENVELTYKLEQSKKSPILKVKLSPLRRKHIDIWRKEDYIADLALNCSIASRNYKKARDTMRYYQNTCHSLMRRLEKYEPDFKLTIDRDVVFE